MPGEIVLDRLLISYLKSQGAHVTLAVKDAPALNDAPCRMRGFFISISLWTASRQPGVGQRLASAWKIFPMI